MLSSCQVMGNLLILGNFIEMWDFKKFRDEVAIISEDGTKYSYSDIERFQKEFFSQIGERTLVFILSTNSIGSLIAYVSALKNNFVPVMLDAQMDYGLLEHLISSYQPRFCWVPEKSDYFPSLEVTYSRFGYKLFKTKPTVKVTLNPQLALLLSTSGSTGSPKFVRQSYKNLLSNTLSIVEYLKLDSNERAITLLPMHYVFGLSIINTHLMAGGSIVLTESSIFKRDFWDLFLKNNVTSISGVPYTFEMLDKLKFYKRKLPSLKTITQAGGKLPPYLHEKFAKYCEENAINFFVMYGASEATARMGYLPPELSLAKKGAMGIAIPGGKFYLIDSDGNHLTNPNEIGELVYKGDNVVLGYASTFSDLNKGDENRGELVTGDLAYFDNDGVYYVVGRKKRFLKVFGNRVGLDELESILKERFNNCEIACTGSDDHVKVFVTNKDEMNNVKKCIAEKVKLNSSAFDIQWIDNIPKNSSGKIKYNELK